MGLFVNEFVFDDSEEPPESDDIDSVSKFVVFLDEEDEESSSLAVVLSEVVKLLVLVSSDFESSLGMNSDDSEFEREKLDRGLLLLVDSSTRKKCSMILRHEVFGDIFTEKLPYLGLCYF